MQILHVNLQLMLQMPIWDFCVIYCCMLYMHCIAACITTHGIYNTNNENHQCCVVAHHPECHDTILGVVYINTSHSCTTYCLYGFCIIGVTPPCYVFIRIATMSAIACLVYRATMLVFTLDLLLSHARCDHYFCMYSFHCFCSRRSMMPQGYNAQCWPVS